MSEVTKKNIDVEEGEYEIDPEKLAKALKKLLTNASSDEDTVTGRIERDRLKCVNEWDKLDKLLGGSLF